MYSVYDRQLGKFIHSGRNSETKKEAMEDVFWMWKNSGGFLVDSSDNLPPEEFKEKEEKETEELLNDEERLEDFLKLLGFKIVEHDKPLDKI